PIEHGERQVGQSAYDFKKRLNMAVDLTLSHSNKPLKLTAKLGFFISLFSMVFGFTIIVQYILFGSTVSGWTSLIVSIFFVFGMITLILGMIGLYVGKIYQQVKDRPLFIVEQTTFGK
ncbi:glycosyltransferase, partial [Clostridium botulinum C/D]|nr:glycosyltransferase [Clostridium botulinum C/D]